MDKIEEWQEHRTKIPSGRYTLRCLKAHKGEIWYKGRGGWGQTSKAILWFEVMDGEHCGKVLPMFLPIRGKGPIPQGSHYFTFWCVANGLRHPERARLKEMPLSKFVGKVFDAEVVDVKPKWNNGLEQPAFFHYSRVDLLSVLSPPKDGPAPHRNVDPLIDFWWTEGSPV